MEDHRLEWIKSTQTDLEDDEHLNQFNFNKIELIVSYYEWCKFLEKHVTGQSRVQFKVFFHDFLSQKLQSEFSFHCWLKPTSNYIKNEEVLLYIAKYKCLHQNCPIVFFCKALRYNDNVIIVLNWATSVDLKQHPAIIKRKRFYGDERQKIAVDLMIAGVKNYQAESILYNTTNEVEDDIILKRCQNVNVLKKIRQEARRQNLISKDLHIDSEAAKILCDELCESSATIKGFIQKISANPFELLMYSDIQVNFFYVSYLWFKIENQLFGQKRKILTILNHIDFCKFYKN